MPHEVELKLQIDPAEIRRLDNHPLLAEHTRQQLPAQQLLSLYYDTPDLRLYRSKVSLRLRRVDSRWLQTVKTEGSVAAGLHDRPEWEQETAENTFNFQALPDPQLREFFADEALRQALRPIFTTVVSRARRVLEWPGGDVVEFALDQGEVCVGERTLPLCEIELEVKSGRPARVFEVARGLLADCPLQLANVSKAERGYRLAANAPLVPEKAQPVVLPGEASTHELLHRTVQSGLAHLQANAEGVKQSEEPEFVHQLRVAARRLRSALCVFAELVAKDQTDPLLDELRWLAKELDGARNWDVFALQTLPPICAAFPHHAGLAWLVIRSAEFRHQSNARAREAVASPRYQRLLLDMGAWLAAPAWQTVRDEQAAEQLALPAAEFATRVLQQRHKKLEKRGKHLTSLSPAERHRVRIAAKQLRYAAEFSASLFPHKRTQRYLAALAQLQDILGAMNDAATTGALVQELAPAEGNVEHHQAQGIVLGWAYGGSHALGGALAQTWNAFRDRNVFWS